MAGCSGSIKNTTDNLNQTAQTLINRFCIDIENYCKDNPDCQVQTDDEFNGMIDDFIKQLEEIV